MYKLYSYSLISRSVILVFSCDNIYSISLNFNCINICFFTS
nr:CPPV242 ankyrin repeat protein [Cooks petrelpox virus]